MPLIENAVTLLKKDHIVTKAPFKALKTADAFNVPGKESLFSKLKHEWISTPKLRKTYFIWLYEPLIMPVKIL